MKRFCLVGALLLLLNGCMFNRQPDPTADWAFSGRFALNAATGNYSGNIFWRQYANHFDVRLRGAFGLGSVYIHGDSNSVVVNSGRQQQQFPLDTSAEISPGIYLPMTQLAQWLATLADIHAEQTATPLADSNWQHEVARIKAFDETLRPTLLKIYNDTTRLKIVIKQWQ